MIYVASSWRNEKQAMVVERLLNEGYNVYDFKHPEPGNNGFHWTDIDPDWKNWTPSLYRKNLQDPIAVESFRRDYAAMVKSHVFVGVQPFGRSAALEMGWAAGNGKYTILLLDNGEPELMVKMLDSICCNIEEVLYVLHRLNCNAEREL